MWSDECTLSFVSTLKAKMKVNRWARVTLTSTLRPRYLVIITSHHGSSQHFHISKKTYPFHLHSNCNPWPQHTQFMVHRLCCWACTTFHYCCYSMLASEAMPHSLRRLELLSYRIGAYSASYTFTNKYTSLHTRTNTESTAPYVWHMPPWASLPINTLE